VVWVLGPDGAPAARRVVLGPSDGKSTAVTQGLDEGDQVLVGGGPQGTGQGGSSPRFGRFL
jgi:multidrug efflux pump subunit AcrA (membrane-fusion protein)